MEDILGNPNCLLLIFLAAIALGLWLLSKRKPQKEDPVKNARERFRQKLDSMSDEQLHRAAQNLRNIQAEDAETKHQVNKTAAHIAWFLIFLCIMSGIVYWIINLP